MKILCFGDFLIHFSPCGHARFMQAETMRMSFTGAEANVCAALSFWGIDTAFVTRLPDHALAKRALASLRACNVDISHCAIGGSRMGIYYLENGASLRQQYWSGLPFPWELYISYNLYMYILSYLKDT